MDPIADMITRIQNAGHAKKEVTIIPYSKVKFAIANLLLKEGYVTFVNRKGRKERKLLELGIAYEDGEPKVHGITRVSKLSRRTYAGFRDVGSVRQGRGDFILSTPQGIITGKEARRNKIGGEVLFKIW
ncbi:30S ribosomal protein S8 [bacterium]|nr:30S ribosomal protein S8 [bacterium]|tara:strand:+ start:214 stop:600 length:387 start_codon:yes stop_codon:yes gene_type:complete